MTEKKFKALNLHSDNQRTFMVNLKKSISYDWRTNFIKNETRWVSELPKKLNSLTHQIVYVTINVLGTSGILRLGLYLDEVKCPTLPEQAAIAPLLMTENITLSFLDSKITLLEAVALQGDTYSP